MKARYRIIKITDGFGKKYCVQKRERILFWHNWVKLINPDHKKHGGTDFPFLPEAIWFIEKYQVKRHVEIVAQY